MRSRPSNWQEVAQQFGTFVFPSALIIRADVAWFTNLHKHSDDPPPCLRCPGRVIYYCQESGCECRVYQQYLARED